MSAYLDDRAALMRLSAEYRQRAMAKPGVTAYERADFVTYIDQRTKDTLRALARKHHVAELL
jgi:hypothetical protein